MAFHEEGKLMYLVDRGGSVSWQYRYATITLGTSLLDISVDVWAIVHRFHRVTNRCTYIYLREVQ